MRKSRYLLLLVVLAFGVLQLSAQTPAPPPQVPTPSSTAPTSRLIPIDLMVSHLPYGSKQKITAQLWDAPTAGNLIFSEDHADVKIGDDGSLHFLLGSATTGGLHPAIFLRELLSIWTFSTPAESASFAVRITMMATNTTTPPIASRSTPRPLLFHPALKATKAIRATPALKEFRAR